MPALQKIKTLPFTEVVQSVKRIQRGLCELQVFFSSATKRGRGFFAEEITTKPGAVLTLKVQFVTGIAF